MSLKELFKQNNSNVREEGEILKMFLLDREQNRLVHILLVSQIENENQKCIC